MCFLKRSWEAIKHWADIYQVVRSRAPERCQLCMQFIFFFFFCQHVHNKNLISVFAVSVFQSDAHLHILYVPTYPQTLSCSWMSWVWLSVILWSTQLSFTPALQLSTRFMSWSSMTALSVCFHHFTHSFCSFIKKSYQSHQCTILPAVDSAGNGALQPGCISPVLVKDRRMASFACAEWRFVFVFPVRLDVQWSIHVSMALNGLSVYV